MIRPATAADGAAIGKVHVLARQDAYAGLVPDSELSGAEADRRLSLWRGRSTWDGIFVAEDADCVCGFGMASTQRDAFLGRSGEIWSLYVLTRAHRRGFGRGLFAAMAAYLHRVGHDGFTLWVLAANRPAVAFYEAMGGTPVAQRRAPMSGGTMAVQTAYAWDGPAT